MGPNLITLVILTYSYTASISASTVAGVEIVTRFDHTTKLPFERITSRDPVNYVVIHHMPKSGGAAQGATTPQAAYYSPESCKATTVHSAQNGHMSNNRWDDIGYDFLIGDDGNIYQVRDFNSMGSPTLQHNTRSVGICMIGDSSDLKLLAKLFNILKNFLENGVANGYIARNYQLIGRSLLETILFPVPIVVIPLIVFLPESMTIVTREEWGAKPPKTPTLFNGPSPYVIIHHSYEPGACYTAKECQEAVQSIQELHQEVRGWSDVGYTFLIGGDGNVYEGRGFNVVGAHAPGYNDKSVGICLIGDWRTLLPNIMMAYVTREEWGAKPAKLVEKFRGPSPYVIIHHSYQPGACFTTDDCKAAMRSMQEFHQTGRGWNDIGYTFAIGGDGNIYEGRGFNVVGAHAPGYNNRSVGICVIGDWRFKLPPPNMLEAVHNLIDYGVSKEFIAKDFKLLGHRQVRDTECPGDRLFDEITTWPHWSAFPSQSNKKINV